MIHSPEAVFFIAHRELPTTGWTADFSYGVSKKTARRKIQNCVGKKSEMRAENFETARCISGLCARHEQGVTRFTVSPPFLATHFRVYALESTTEDSTKHYHKLPHLRRSSEQTSFSCRAGSSE
jgi:hypothetical protein